MKTQDKKKGERIQMKRCDPPAANPLGRGEKPRNVDQAERQAGEKRRGCPGQGLARRDPRGGGTRLLDPEVEVEC